MILLTINHHAMHFACLCMRLAFLGAVVSLYSSSVRADEPVNYDAVIGKIKTALPGDWTLAETKADALPEGHYWGLEYEGPKGLELVLQGKTDVHFHWKDKDGEWHQEPVAKEALILWVMASNYKESWLRFFVIHRPKTAKLLFSGQVAKVYSYPSSRIIAIERVDEIVKLASTMGWPDSPSNTGILSWKTWKDDLQRAFQSE